MNAKKLLITATTVGTLGLAAVGLGAGVAQADDHGHLPWPNPPGPGVLPPPGHIGQIVGVPPGQWDKGPVFIPFCDGLNPGCVNHL